MVLLCRLLEIGRQEHGKQFVERHLSDADARISATIVDIDGVFARDRTASKDHVVDLPVALVLLAWFEDGVNSAGDKHRRVIEVKECGAEPVGARL